MTQQPKFIYSEKHWDNGSIIDFYDSHRRLFRVATKPLVQSIFQEFINPSDTILEIGSGLGELVYNLLPPKIYTISQTDIGKDIIATHKKNHPNSNILYANAYHLPFPSESFDIIIGFASFDTFAFLPKALKEMKRVLKKNGKIIHFLDIYACPEAFFQKILQQYQDSIPFPLLKDGHIKGISVVKKATYKKEKLAIDMLLLPLYESYQHNPQKLFSYLSKPQSSSLFGFFAQDIANRFPTSTPIYFNDFFHKELLHGAYDCKLYIEQCGLQENHAIVKRSNIYKLFSRNNALINDVGFISMYTLPQKEHIPKDSLYISTIIHIAILTK